MAYTTPKTWVTGELVTATEMNTYMRDNQNALKSPPTDSYVLNEGSDYTTTSTSFVDVDATNLALTITTTGGDVFVHFHGSVNSNTYRIYFELDVDGSPHAGDDGITHSFNSGGNDRMTITFTRLITGLSAGSHTIKLQWKSSSSTITLFAGAGTSNVDVHPQFWAREVS
jgi:hypothetical protein